MYFAVFVTDFTEIDARICLLSLAFVIGLEHLDQQCRPPAAALQHNLPQ